MTDQQTRVAVGPSDGLPEVLNRLRNAAGTSVALEIPDASSLFLTASEFRALQATVDRDGIVLTVATGDPFRQQLAALFQLPVAPVANEPEPATTTTENAVPMTAPPAEPVSSQAPENAAAQTAAVSASSSTDQIAAPATEEPPAHLSRWSRVQARIRAATGRQRLVAVAALVGIVILAYLGAYLFLTRATVVLTLKRQAISRTFSVAVAAPGASAPAADLVVAATPVTFDVSTSQTMNVTGSKTVGDAAAQGTVSLSNPTDKPVSVEAGTRLKDKITETTYAIVATVEVPAGKDGAPGFGEATVVCLEPGTAGNRDTGLLSGRLDNGVYFANRNGPIAGGTDKQIPVVAQTDLDTLQARAADDLKAQAAMESPGGEAVVLAPSVQLEQPAFTPDHRVGDQAATLTMRATARASGLAYNPADLHDRVADALATDAPDGYEFDHSSLQLSTPTADDGNAQAVRLSVQATGSATALLTAENRREIAGGVAGGDEAAARAYLAALTQIDGFEIRYSPGWLPHRIPSSAGRVRIETR